MEDKSKKYWHIDDRPMEWLTKEEIDQMDKEYGITEEDRRKAREIVKKYLKEKALKEASNQ